MFLLLSVGIKATGHYCCITGVVKWVTWVSHSFIQCRFICWWWITVPRRVCIWHLLSKPQISWTPFMSINQLMRFWQIFSEVLRFLCHLILSRVFGNILKTDLLCRFLLLSRASWNKQLISWISVRFSCRCCLFSSTFRIWCRNSNIRQRIGWVGRAN